MKKNKQLLKKFETGIVYINIIKWKDKMRGEKKGTKNNIHRTNGGHLYGSVS